VIHDDVFGWTPPPAAPEVDDHTYGMELVMDVHGCDPAVITSTERLATYTQRLCDEILHMRRYGDPLIERFGLAADKTAGYTLVQLIETSSVTGHFSDAWRAGFLNVFSCRTFDPAAVVAFTESWFRGRCASHVVLIRGAARAGDSR
jgi:S-adenosylmethionine decarboxylase